MKIESSSCSAAAVPGCVFACSPSEVAALLGTADSALGLAEAFSWEGGDALCHRCFVKSRPDVVTPSGGLTVVRKFALSSEVEHPGDVEGLRSQVVSLRGKRGVVKFKGQEVPCEITEVLDVSVDGDEEESDYMVVAKATLTITFG